MSKQLGASQGRTKEAKLIAKAVRKAGGTVELTSRGHLKVKGPAGIAIVASSSDSWHAIPTALRTIRNKAGLDVTL